MNIINLETFHINNVSIIPSAIKKALIVCAMFVCFMSTAQEKNWSIEGNFPYTFGDNFVDEGYNGVVDFGVKYRIRAYSKFDLGASFNVGAFIRDDSRFDGNNLQEINGNAVLLQPRVFASYVISSAPRLHPMVGLGYSVFLFNVNNQNFNGADFQQNRSDSGINVNLGLAYDLNDYLLIQLQYDYIRLNARDVIDSPFNKNVNIIKLGFGYRF